MALITRPLVVVHLFPQRLLVGKTRIGRHTFMTETTETEWDPTTLAEIFGEIRQTYQCDSIRLVLEDQLAHTFNVTIPKKVTDLRQYLAEQIEKKFGVVPGPQEWDYRKAVFPLGRGGKALVFAPKKEVLEIITQAANQAELTIEAMEPVEVARKRDPDPMIGIALKHDLAGLDDDVLNISIRRDGGSKNMNWKLILMIIFVLLVGSIAVGAYLAWQKFPTRINSENVEKTTPTPLTVQPEASPAVAKEETIKLEDYKVQVLNGSGVAGRAGEVKEKLIKAGFETVEAKNAERFDYLGVTLQTKTGTPTKVLETITPLLGVNITTTTGTTLPSTSEFDVILTLGQSTVQ